MLVESLMQCVYYLCLPVNWVWVDGVNLGVYVSMSWINERSRNKALHKEPISPFLRGALTNQYHPLNRTTEAIPEQPWPIKVSGPSERFRISNFKMHLVGSFLSSRELQFPVG